MADREFKIRIVAETGQAKRGFEDLSKGTGDAIKGVEGFTIKGRDMSKLIRELSGISPALGLALRAAFSPQTIGIASLLLLIRSVAGAWKESQEAARQAAEQSVAAVAAAREVAESYTRSLESFKTKLDEVNSASDQLATKHDRQKQLLEADLDLEAARTGKADPIGAEKNRLFLSAAQLIDLRAAEGTAALKTQTLQAQADAMLPEAARAKARMAGKDEKQLEAEFISLRERFSKGGFLGTPIGAVSTGELTAAGDALRNFRRDKATVDKFQTLQTSIEGARSDQLAATSAREQHENRFTTAQRLLPVHEQTNQANVIANLKRELGIKENQLNELIQLASSQAGISATQIGQIATLKKQVADLERAVTRGGQ